MGAASVWRGRDVEEEMEELQSFRGEVIECHGTRISFTGLDISSLHKPLTVFSSYCCTHSTINMTAFNMDYSKAIAAMKRDVALIWASLDQNVQSTNINTNGEFDIVSSFDHHTLT